MFKKNTYEENHVLRIQENANRGSMDGTTGEILKYGFGLLMDWLYKWWEYVEEVYSKPGNGEDVNFVVFINYLWGTACKECGFGEILSD